MFRRLLSSGEASTNHSFKHQRGQNNQQMHWNCLSFFKMHLYIAPTRFSYSLPIIRVYVIWYNVREQCASRHTIHTPLHRATLKTQYIFTSYL